MEIKNFKMINKGSLKAKFDLFFPKLGFSVREFMLIESAKGKFVTSPSRSYEDAEGKKKYYAFFQVVDDRREDFQHKVLQLLEPILSQWTAVSPRDENGEVPF